MTNTEPASSKAEPFVTIPCSVIEYVRTLKLTGTQYAFWLYLLVLDPYGDRWIEVPSPSELAPVFKVDIRTLQRAAQRLDDADLFEFEVTRWKARNNQAIKRAANFPTDKGIHLTTKRSGLRQKDPTDGKKIQMSEKADLAGTLGINGFHVGTSDSKECTNNRSNRSNRSNKQEQIGTGTEADSLRSIDSEGIGTAVDSSQKLDTPILQQITNSGIRINKTIEQALAEAQQNYGSAAACRAVENALSSLAEQRKVGTVRNPGGFFVAALRRGFTSNEGKKKAKQGKAPDLGQLEMQIDSYLLDGHRDWAEDKLQAVWSDGWESHVRSMLKNRKDWGFAVSDQGVKNDQST